MKKVKIQQFLLDYAHDLTEKRVAINRERYAGTNKQRKGSINSHLLGEVSREYYTEYMGIIGELLTRYYYEITPEYTSYTASTLIKDGRLVTDDVDLTVTKMGAKKKIGIKAGERSFKFNAKALEKEDSDEIVFLVFTSPTDYVVQHFTVEEIRKWDLKQGPYGAPYYEKRI